MYTLGLGSFLGDFADRYTPGELQYGTSEEVNRRQKTENLIDERNFNKERMVIMPYKNKKGILNLLLFLALSTITFSNFIAIYYTIYDTIKILKNFEIFISL